MEKVFKKSLTALAMAIVTVLIAFGTMFNVNFDSGIISITPPTTSGDTWDKYAVKPSNEGYEQIFDPSGQPCDAWHITSPNELAWLISNIGMQDYNEIYLENDIDLSGHEWLPINPTSSQAVVFYGQGYTISNLTIDSRESSIGLFKTCGRAQDVNFYNVDIRGGSQVGTLVGNVATGNFSNIKIQSGFVRGNAKVGGILGSCNSLTLTNCTNNAQIIGKESIGGIIGFIGNTVGKFGLVNCINTGDIYGGINVGGLIGGVFVMSSLPTIRLVKNSYVECQISAENYAGGLLGKDSSSSVGSSMPTRIDHSGFNGSFVFNSKDQSNCNFGSIISYSNSFLKPVLLNCFGIAKVNVTGFESIDPDLFLEKHDISKSSYTYEFIEIHTPSNDSEYRRKTEIRNYTADFGESEEFAVNPYINGGFPFPKTLFAVGEFIEEVDVLAYLQEYGFTEINA